jgi:G3E family GTPase
MTQKPKPRYIMIGGFLGAGKSTTILKLAKYLQNKSIKVGLITNDQSVGLVDTNVATAAGYDVEEITGGCFCCRFDSLVDAADRLSKSNTPDVFIAEPVGSCTDLVATVSYPLRRMYGDAYTIAPMSVLVDPIRCMRVLGLDDGKTFSQKVMYIYRKQLEEAKYIVINKCDLLSKEQLDALASALQAEFPASEVFVVSARDGQGLEPWFDRIVDEEITIGPAMEVDYQLYGEGEALLGWLNATVTVSSEKAFDGEVVMLDIAQHIQKELAAQGFEIAHLKMTLMRQGGAEDVAVLNLVRNDYVPEMSQSLFDKLLAGELVINVRAEGDPELIKAATVDAINVVAAKLGVTVTTEHIEHFRPGQPTPTHRVEI